MEDMWDIMKVLEIQGNTHNKVEVQANSDSRSLTLSPTQTPGPPCLQIDIWDQHLMWVAPQGIEVDEAKIEAIKSR
jgi:hypothetical protein